MHIGQLLVHLQKWIRLAWQHKLSYEVIVLFVYFSFVWLMLRDNFLPSNNQPINLKPSKIQYVHRLLPKKPNPWLSNSSDIRSVLPTTPCPFFRFFTRGLDVNSSWVSSFSTKGEHNNFIATEKTNYSGCLQCRCFPKDEKWSRTKLLFIFFLFFYSSRVNECGICTRKKIKTKMKE